MKKSQKAPVSRSALDEDSGRIDFIARNVYEINSLSSEHGEKVEVVYYRDDDNDREVITAIGQTREEALRYAIDAAADMASKSRVKPRGKSLCEVFAEEDKASNKHVVKELQALRAELKDFYQLALRG